MSSVFGTVTTLASGQPVFSGTQPRVVLAHADDLVDRPILTWPGYGEASSNLCRRTSSLDPRRLCLLYQTALGPHHSQITTSAQAASSVLTAGSCWPSAAH